MSTTTTEWTIEMHWRCSHCRTLNPGMAGTERESLKCSHCGAEKSDEPWVMPDAPETAPRLSGDLDAKARAGANWSCSHCEAESRADHAECEVCGAPRAVPVTLEPAVRASIAPTRPMRAATPREPYVAAERDVDVVQRIGIASVLKAIGAVAAACLAVWFSVWLFSPNETVVRVASMVWSRERRLEERHDYAGEGWRRQAPPLVYAWDNCASRQSGTEQCHPHQCRCRPQTFDCRCTGGDTYSCRCRNVCRRSCSSNRNGSARCSETCRESCSTCTHPRRCSTCTRTVCDTCYDTCPVFEQWCSYRYHRWDEIVRRRLDGRGQTCAWPDVQAHGELQRVESSERYDVRFDDTESRRTWARTYDYGTYSRFDEGQRWRTEWTHAGGFTLKERAR